MVVVVVVVVVVVASSTETQRIRPAGRSAGLQLEVIYPNHYSLLWFILSWNAFHDLHASGGTSPRPLSIAKTVELVPTSSSNTA